MYKKGDIVVFREPNVKGIIAYAVILQDTKFPPDTFTKYAEWHELQDAFACEAGRVYKGQVNPVMVNDGRVRRANAFDIAQLKKAGLL